MSTAPLVTTAPGDMPENSLVSLRDLRVDYRTGKKSYVPVIRGVDLDLYRDESIAIVGESGCGKTTLALAVLRLLPKLGRVSGGTITYRQRAGGLTDVLALDGQELRRFRWTEASIVYQGSMNALNPLLKVRRQFHETVRAHRRNMSADQVEQRSADLLRMVQLEPGRVLPSYPHELSGGMRQRVLIALGLLLDPQLVVLDEPTTALDILTQRAVVEVLREVKDQMHFTMVFVTHDLPLAAELADRVATMYGGRIVELSGVNDTFYAPRHPYTIGLIKAVPPVYGDVPEIASIPGTPPSFGDLPGGCSFHTRCPFAEDICTDEDPPLFVMGERHDVACHFADQMSLARTVGDRT
ncbi:MAG: ABC transporter ATP-binding protein [Mycobacteriales bacterium]